MGRLWLIVIGLIFAGLGGAAVMLLRPPVAAPATDAIGAAIAVDPSANIAPQGAAAAVAAVNAAVHADDLVTTGGDGAIRIRFVDATFFSLGANASVRIDSFVFDPAQSASKMVLSFTKGAFRFVSGRAVHAYPGQPAIRTPAAVIGVRGTGVTGVIGPEAEALFRAIDPSFVPDGGDSTTATLIILTDGAIDVEGSDVRIAMDVPGQAIFFRRRGAVPIGPILVPTGVMATIGALASPPSLGPEPGDAAQRVVVPEGVASDAPEVEPGVVALPSATPTVTVQPSPTPTPTVVRPSPTPTVRPSATPTPRPTVTPRATPSPRFTPRPIPTPTPRVTPRPSPTPRFTPRPTPTPRVTPRPTATPKPVATPTPRPTRRPSLTLQPGTLGQPGATPTPRPRATTRPRPNAVRQ